jgi:PAS domain S-box-containing protein
MSAENTELPAMPLGPPLAADTAPAVARRGPRGRLFRKYVLFFVGLVAVALLVNGGFDFWFGYQENKEALIHLQQEKADAAAQRIEEFIEGIERQIGWTTHAQWSAAPLDQRRFDYVRLLSQVPAITEISELDRDGKEQLKVSRLAMDVVGSNQDFSQSPAFGEARAHKVWFSPVYFRKESEPYMTLALARAGRNAGVTVAEINLKLILDVITGLRVGQGGYVYVVDNRGKLIAHPDISLVLRDTDFGHLTQVAAALPTAQAAGAAPAVSVTVNNDGLSVLSAHAAIPQLGWQVFVEVPLREAFAPLYGAALRSGLLLLFGLAGATLVALFLARRMTVPIRALQEGAARFGAGELDRRLDIRTGDEIEALAEQFNSMAADLHASYAELEHKVEERTAELSESLEYQTATSDVLKVISRSTFDLQPVLDTVAETAARLCGADMAMILRKTEFASNLEASFGFPPAYEAFLNESYLPRYVAHSPPHNTITGQTITEGRTVHIADVAADPAYLPEAIALGKMRTALGVPLMRQKEVIGVIALSRQRVEPFSERQIELVQTFADQAVIAIENTRLITETREALDQQTATAEVLGVINSSPGDLTPVFDAILEKAHRLCGAAYGSLQLYDGGQFRAVAVHNLPAVLADRLREGYSPGPNSPLRRLLDGGRFVHIPDMAEIDDPVFQGVVELSGMRTFLSVALRKDDLLLGQIVSARYEVHPFAEQEVALLQNFAAQAVIAMENARLITETQEALDQQTATAEVLQVINSSPGNLAPVFDAMLDKAMRLCEAALGVLWTYDGDAFHLAASRGAPPAYAEFLAGGPRRPSPATAHGRLQHGSAFEHIADVAASEDYRQGDAFPRALVDLAGGRTILAVPLRKDRAFLGDIFIYRQEVRPFTEKQIALLQSFAVQAVIAMENARLITETQEALDQQTATAEVLGVINASPGDLAPVFEAMLEKAMRLCGAVFGELRTYDGASFRTAATRGVPAAFVEYRANNPPAHGPGTGPARILAGERLIHDVDLMDSDAYRDGEPNRRALVGLGGVRTSLQVPLRKDDAVLGSINIYRQEVRAFSDKEIALLENFAAQAVIAMENARLLDQIRQRQAELRVTFDNMADGVVMFDEALRLAAWNRNFQELLDLPDELLAGRPAYADYLHILASRGEFGAGDVEAELSRRLAHTDEELRFERTRPDGRVVEVRRNAVAGGGFVLIYSDITERKRSEQEIRAARDAAERALGELKTAQRSLIQAEKMASLGQLTAGIAHEIKNPLNFVNNFAGLSVELLDELKEVAAPAIAALDADKRAELDETIGMLTGNLEKIAEHGKRADNIVKSMLEHSRGVTGERRAVDLNALVEESLSLAYHGARAQDQSFNITLERDFDAGLRPVELVPQDITRVLLNLFGNGFYAASKRAVANGGNGFRPVLRVATQDAGDAVEVRVRDNGTGIPPDIRDKLFQPFFTTKPTGEGTGLGLSISYDIVTQQHGGTIAVASEEGAFTEFTIRLPRAPGTVTGQATRTGVSG